MKKLLNAIFGIIVYFIGATLFMGYGHTETHVPLNTSIGLRFLEIVSTNAVEDKYKFKNFEFNWNNDKQPSLTGLACAGDGYTPADMPADVEKTYSPMDWIAQGGWMEDEPWGPASLCHFYDPKGIDNGKKYLTDNSGNVEWFVSIPKAWFSRDAKSWSTGTENQYSWPKAKEYVIKALKESDVALKNKYMAMAYRCLGQTLHLVSDMGCTPHVRNDSHPPKISFLVGDPDPYENICKVLDVYTLAKANAPSPGLKSQVTATLKYADIFEALAVYTNEKYYSGGTIYTDRYKPLIRPGNPYPSPLMTEVEYNASEYAYYKTNDGVRVKMCKDKVAVPWYVIVGKDSTRGRPYLDYECVESMAAAVIPNVVEAGANVIRMFVPSLKMEISEAKLDSGGIVRGKIAYTIPSFDDEYSGKFDLNDTYNGPVTLFVNGTDTKIQTIAKKNNFEFKLNGILKDLKKDDKVVTRLDFGGIVLKSDEKKVGSSNIMSFVKSCRYIAFQITMKATFADGTLLDTGIPSYLDNFDHRDYKTYLPITWNGNAFSITRNFVDIYYPYFKFNYTLTGLLQDDGTVTSCSLSYTDSDKYNITVKVEGIKVTMINPVAEGAVYMEMDSRKAVPNGILKEFTYYHPDHGAMKSMVPNTFFAQLCFRPSY